MAWVIILGAISIFSTHEMNAKIFAGKNKFMVNTNRASHV